MLLNCLWEIRLKKMRQHLNITQVDQPRSVSREDAGEWAKSRGMLFMEASAKTKEGIAQVFNEVVQKVSFSCSIFITSLDSGKSDLIIKH